MVSFFVPHKNLESMVNKKRGNFSNHTEDQYGCSDYFLMRERSPLMRFIHQHHPVKTSRINLHTAHNISLCGINLYITLVMNSRESRKKSWGYAATNALDTAGKSLKELRIAKKTKMDI